MKSEYEIKVTGTSANWSFGTVRKPGGGEILCFQVKHYDEPSQYGIDAGRISKLCVRRDGESKDLRLFRGLRKRFIGISRCPYLGGRRFSV